MTGWTPAEHEAMGHALTAAADLTIAPGANPRVGCVLLDRAGQPLALGVHRGPGTPHAEVDALRQVEPGRRVHCAVVTLEPCDHHGRTGPCTQALIDADVQRVVLGIPDPNPVAAGGAARLRAAGIEVVAGCRRAECEALDENWLCAVELGRPHVTWKLAATLDGRVAAADGSSRWISGATSREQAHRLRAASDAVIVGTGTVLADDPSLMVRGFPAVNPLRVVVGRRPIPADARVLDNAAPLLQIDSHDPQVVLETLWDRGVRRVLLEGGPTLAGAFVAAGAVDRVVAFLAPKLLGAGQSALGDAGIGTITDALDLQITGVSRTGDDVMIDARVRGAR